MNHAALLSSFIEEALKTTGKKPDAVAVSSGPGSYTGLRIGVSTAKGLCYGWGIPLIAVSTLETMASQALKAIADNSKALFCPMIDARRMEVYSAFYNAKGEPVEGVSANIITETSFSETLEKQPVYFFGNGAAKCKTVLTHSNALFLENIVPLATDMIQLAERAFKNKQFVDVAYFEPFYLKEFQVTTPKNKVLG